MVRIRSGPVFLQTRNCLVFWTIVRLFIFVDLIPVARPSFSWKIQLSAKFLIVISKIPLCCGAKGVVVLFNEKNFNKDFSDEKDFRKKYTPSISELLHMRLLHLRMQMYCNR